MRPEGVPAELVERAVSEYLPGLYDTGAEAMRHALAAVLPDIQAQALREAADCQGPADEAAHFTPEARNLLRSLADRISVLATEDDRCNIPGGCCTHENTHNGLGIAGVGECTDCMNTGHMHPIEEETT